MRNPPAGYRPDGWTPSAAQQQSARTDSLREAISTWQRYGLWTLLFLNTTAGIGPMLVAALRQSSGQYSDAFYAIAVLMFISTAIPVFVRAPDAVAAVRLKPDPTARA